MIGRIHSIQTLGTLDGPGLRMVIFMQGCTLRCQYCHNPDSWDFNTGTIYTVEELFHKVLRIKPYFGDVGGLTISGGEPLLQAPFVTALFQLCKVNGISTALDTSGVGSDFSVLDYTDTVILDIKATDIKSYFDMTGGQLENMEKFLRKCLDLGKQIWIRQVIVPGINDDKKSINQLSDYLQKACFPLAPSDAFQQITLLPYHTLGIYKWDEMNIDNPLKNKPPASIEQVAELEKHLHKCLQF